MFFGAAFFYIRAWFLDTQVAMIVTIGLLIVLLELWSIKQVLDWGRERDR